MAKEIIFSSRSYVADQAGQYVFVSTESGSVAQVVVTPLGGRSETTQLRGAAQANFGSLAVGTTVAVLIFAGVANVNSNIVNDGDKIRRAPVGLYEGDSITARGLATPLPVAIGASNAFAGEAHCGYTTYERMLGGFSFDIVNRAQSGETTSQIVTRLLNTDLSDFDFVSLLCGTNDVGSGVTTADVPTVFNLIVSAVEYVGKFGIPIRVLTVPPRTSTAWANAGQRAFVLLLNSRIKSLPQRYEHCFVGDAFSAIQDPTSADPAPLANTLYDGSYNGSSTHPSEKGAYLIASLAGWPSLQRLFSSVGLGYNAINGVSSVTEGGSELLTNTDFTTQTGGTDSTSGLLTGTVPSGWRLLRNTGAPTAVASSFPFFVAEALRQRGNWVTSRAYRAGDAVTQTSIAYICVTGHTAGTFATDLSNGLWKRVWSGEYCWQLDVTCSAADQGIYVQRSSVLGFAATDILEASAILTKETGDVKQATVNFEGFNSAATARSHKVFAPYSAFSVPHQELAETVCAVHKTPRLPIAALGESGLNSQQFRIDAVGSAASTFSIVIARPSLKKF